MRALKQYPTPSRERLSTPSLDGKAVVYRHDIELPVKKDEPLYLHSGASKRIDLWVPEPLREYPSEIIGFSPRTALAQLGVDATIVDITEAESPQIVTTMRIENLGPHPVCASESFAMGKFVALGTSLKGADFKKACDNAVRTDPDTIYDPDLGLLYVPLDAEGLTHTNPSADLPIDLAALPTGTRREYFHRHTGIEPGNGEPIDGITHLAKTKYPVVVSDTHCLWIEGCRDRNGIPDKHSESRLMYGGYEWPIISETYIDVTGGHAVFSVREMKIVG